MVIHRKRMIVTACSLAFISVGTLAAEQSATSTSGTSAETTSGASAQTNTRAGADAAKDAEQHLDKAVKVLQQMESDAKMKQLLREAKGVFIIPNYGQAALGVGAEGGPGVLLVKQRDTWGAPAFYNTGGLSVGAQAGAQGGAVAFVLNNDKALNSFRKDNKFSLTADAGLTVVNWSKVAEGSAGKGDVVAWTDTRGLFGGVAIGINNVNFDENETAAYYQKQTVMASDVINGKVKNPHAAQLKQALAEPAAGTATGGSGATPSGRSGDASGTSAEPSREPESTPSKPESNK